MDIIEQSSLYYQDNKSDKVYQATFEQTEDCFIVKFRYGRRGSNLKEGIKIESPCYEECEYTYRELVQSKLKKGYKHYE